MSRPFRFKREDETWADSYARACRKAGKIWVHVGLTFLFEVIAESMWRAMGWVCDERPNAADPHIKTRFQMEKYEMVAVYASIRCERGPV